MSEYPKIPGPFKRAPERPHPVIPWAWSSHELALLSDVDWHWYEKIDGTNIRVIWDGHKPEFRGRTDRAEIPAHLLAKLQELFPEEILEQQFGSTEAVLYGEGFGPKIQKGGGLYGDEVDFALFDVRIGHVWLRQEDVGSIGCNLGLRCAPYYGDLTLIDAIHHVHRGWLSSHWAGVEPEGLVGRPEGDFLDRMGRRIIVKLKPENVG